MTELIPRASVDMAPRGSKVVYKYMWPGLKSEAVFEMPRDAEILCAHEQHNQICIWARVVIGRDIERRRFVLCGTGEQAPDLEHRYIGTAFMQGGSLVWHIFEPFR